MAKERNDVKQQKLGLFDVTNLLVGAIVGADIYVVASLGSGELGPASLLAWAAAGAIAIVIALNFAKCATLVSRVGGAYSYVRAAWGNFVGFIVGWALWLAEVAALAVFPVAFVRYLTFFYPGLTWVQGAVIKFLFIAVITYSNIRGTKTAGRTNDALTLAKLSPLLLLIVAGLAYMAFYGASTQANFTPFAPLGLSQFGTAITVIVWAYAGFELAVIPANDIDNPSSTIPKAIVIGMAIVTTFYLLTNIVLLGTVNWAQLQYDQAPLATAGGVIFSLTPVLAFVGSAIIGVGALVSVSGSDESGTLSVSRLSYAMSIDGLFPKLFGKLHPKYGTPYKGLIAQSSLAFVGSLIGGIQQLITFSVFNLAFVYLMTCAVVLVLLRRKEESVAQFTRTQIRSVVISALGILVCIFLLVEVGTGTVIFGAITVLIGVPIYMFYSPRKESSALVQEFYSAEATLVRVAHTQRVFLGYLLQRARNLARRTKTAQPPNLRVEK